MLNEISSTKHVKSSELIYTYGRCSMFAEEGKLSHKNLETFKDDKLLMNF